MSQHKRMAWRRGSTSPDAKYRTQFHARLENLSNYPVLKSQTDGKRV